jgi:hypothetical protein
LAQSAGELSTVDEDPLWLQVFTEEDKLVREAVGTNSRQPNAALSHIGFAAGKPTLQRPL